MGGQQALRIEMLMLWLTVMVRRLTTRKSTSFLELRRRELLPFKRLRSWFLRHKTSASRNESAWTGSGRCKPLCIQIQEFQLLEKLSIDVVIYDEIDISFGIGRFEFCILPLTAIWVRIWLYFHTKSKKHMKKKD